MVNIPGFATGPITSTALPIRMRDRLLDGANGGVLGLWDASYFRSFAGAETGRAPLKDEVIYDIATIEWDGTQSATTYNGTMIEDFAGGLPSYAGNGFDYSTSTAIGSTVTVPNIAEHVTAQTEQYWYECIYLRLPIKTDWLAVSGTRPFSCYTTNANGFQAEPDLLTIAQIYSSAQQLRAIRTTSAGVYEQLTMTPYDAHFGQVAQILWWRNADGIGLQLRTAAGGIQSVTGAVGVKTTQGLTGKKRRTGLGRSFWPGTVTSTRNFRLYRGWTEDTELSGRDARTVADQDWTRVMARPAHVAFS